MTEVVPDLLNKTKEPAAEPVTLPESRRGGKDRPENYLPDPGLVDAVRAALLLRRPLLLTGEPGTGKTQCANYLSWKLGYGPEALHFQAKSTSTARDLFYTYNTIGRFHAAQTKEGSQNSVDYIKYNALGEAILRANTLDSVEKWLPKGFIHTGKPMQSLVLIDEIDKAPRDFPNDVLSEIETMRFRIPEFDNVQLAADAEFLPAVLITSNSEKNLPAPFLRRCVYYHIPKPDKKRFGEIVERRTGDDPASPLIDEALDFLMFARGPEADLNKKPATAELLDFVLLLEAHGAKTSQRLKDIRPVVEASLGALIKDEGRDGKELLTAFLNSKQ
jgi:MoxR-like ATPase